MDRNLADRSKRRRETLDAPKIDTVGRLLLEPSLPPKKRPQIQPQQPSGLLERLQSFLPGLEAANAKLNGKQASEISIERTGDENEPYIELELACGLFDLKTPEALAAAERNMNGAAQTAEETSSQSSSDSEDASAMEICRRHLDFNEADVRHIPPKSCKVGTSVGKRTSKLRRGTKQTNKIQEL